MLSARGTKTGWKELISLLIMQITIWVTEQATPKKAFFLFEYETTLNGYSTLAITM